MNSPKKNLSKVPLVFFYNLNVCLHFRAKIYAVGRFQYQISQPRNKFRHFSLSLSAIFNHSATKKYARNKWFETSKIASSDVIIAH